jgi:phosphoenolpyruvate synthase/pyruvate phosphate dikinase
MYEAGGRLFVDVTREMSSAAGRAGLIGMAGKSDPLIGDALQTVIDRGDFVPVLLEGTSSHAPPARLPTPLAPDPAIVDELIESGDESNARLAREIGTKSEDALFEFLLTDLQELKRTLFEPRSYAAIMAGMEATWWLNDHLEQWIGEKGAADIFAQSVPNNVTSEMGLDLLRVADAIRPHPSVVAFLQEVTNDDFLNDLPRIPGGAEARDAIQAWLDKYGMRCVGEIDITRPRWIERPTTLLPMILGNIKNFGQGAGELRFEQGLRTARAKEEEILQRVRALPDGESKAQDVKSMIDRLRTFVGYREYPKYFIVTRYLAYKRALLAEADRLVEAGIIDEREDIYFLTLPELRDVVRTSEVDHESIRARRKAFEIYQGLTPPRVLTSDGEMISGSYRGRDVPPGALVGLAVSAGVVEGRARVVFDPAKAVLEPGDILVTPFTDPSWTPLFVTIAGLVTEVGGLMTHGAVIAREYGLPAIVGLEHATRLIRDGQLIRLDGTNGFVEIVD